MSRRASRGTNRPLRMPQVKFLQPLLPEQAAWIELLPLSDAADAPQRWRFRVLRDETPIAGSEVRTVCIASGEVHEVHPA